MNSGGHNYKKKKKHFVAFPWVETSTGPGGFMICVFINMTGTPEGSTESGFMEKPGIEPATPGLQGIALIHYTTGGIIIKKNFLWLSLGRNQYWAGRVYDLCVYYMTGAPEGSPKVVLCGFMFVCFFCFFVFFLWRSRESNLRPLVYKA